MKRHGRRTTHFAAVVALLGASCVPRSPADVAGIERDCLTGSGLTGAVAVHAGQPRSAQQRYQACLAENGVGFAELEALHAQERRADALASEQHGSPVEAAPSPAIQDVCAFPSADIPKYDHEQERRWIIEQCQTNREAIDNTAKCHTVVASLYPDIQAAHDRTIACLVAAGRCGDATTVEECERRNRRATCVPRCVLVEADDALWAQSHPTVCRAPTKETDCDGVKNYVEHYKDFYIEGKVDVNASGTMVVSGPHHILGWHEPEALEALKAGLPRANDFRIQRIVASCQAPTAPRSCDELAQEAQNSPDDPRAPSWRAALTRSDPAIDALWWRSLRGGAECRAPQSTSSCDSLLAYARERPKSQHVAEVVAIVKAAMPRLRALSALENAQERARWAAGTPEREQQRADSQRREDQQRTERERSDQQRGQQSQCHDGCGTTSRITLDRCDKDRDSCWSICDPVGYSHACPNDDHGHQSEACNNCAHTCENASRTCLARADEDRNRCETSCH
jgi:hypothetical protein